MSDMTSLPPPVVTIERPPRQLREAAIGSPVIGVLAFLLSFYSRGVGLAFLMGAAAVGFGALVITQTKGRPPFAYRVAATVGIVVGGLGALIALFAL